MDARLQRRVQRYGWDKAVTHYEQYWSQQLEPAQDALMELAELKPGERVLDTACGTGLVTFPAATAVGSGGGHVLGTDISQKMVETAGALAAERGIENVAFERMDAETLELDEASFDAVLCSLGLMYVPDPAAAMSAAYKALQPGGRTVAAVWGARGNCGWAEIFPIVDHRVNSEVCPMFFQLGTGDNMEYLLEQAGFSRITTRRVPTTLHYESGEAACGAAFAGGPVALAYSRFDDQTREETHAEYLASIEPYRNGPGYEIPGEFVIARGWKE